MIITFVGHGALRIDANLSEKIVQTIKDNVQEKENITFYCGGYGDFDNHCASICRKFKMELSCEVVFKIKCHFGITLEDLFKKIL